MSIKVNIFAFTFFLHNAVAFSQPQKCDNAGFQKKIGGFGDDRATDIKVTPNNEFLIAGSTTTGTGLPVNNDALFLKLDQNGNEIWQFKMGGARDDEFSKVLILKDGNYLVMGNSQSFHHEGGSILVVKFDTAGNILLQKELNLQASSHLGTTNITAIVELNDGSIAFSGNALGINTDVGQPLEAIFNLIGVLDSNGNIKWIKRGRMYYVESGANMRGMVQLDNLLFAIVGNGVLRMSTIDGGLVGFQQQFPDLSEFYSIENIGDDIFIYSANHMVHRNRYDMIFPLGVIYYHGMEMEGFSTEGGYGLIGSIPNQGNNRSKFITMTNDDGHSVWSYSFPYSAPNFKKFYGSRLTKDNGIVAIGITKENEENFTEPYDILLMRTDTIGGIAACPRSGFQFYKWFEFPDVIELHFRFYPISGSVFSGQLQRIAADLPILDHCKSNCQTLELVGNDGLCSLNDTLFLYVRRNNGCTATTDWKTDDSLFNIVSLTDTSMALVAKKEGTTMIRATISNGCQLLKDSLLLHLYVPPLLNLGPDVELCMVKSFQLNARRGFKSYLWNNGSSDSILTVTAAGSYFITTTDYCGISYHDTINVTEATDLNFDLGPDLSKCNDDTLALTAPIGFSSYLWLPNYNSISANSRTVNLYPSVDTGYKVIAERGTGCIVMDSIRIKVNRSPKIDLGNDISICLGDSLILEAGPNFTGYLWNTGSTNSRIIAKERGTYSVTAAYINGCISRDELIIQSIYNLPEIDLGPDTEYCKNEKFELVARGGYYQYQWSNNLTSSIIPISSPGTYWVKVTSKDGCISRDTVNLREKECLQGVFFPNAFTPNNDRTNNSFKPAVHGNLESYHLVIYNRWGQRVFETRDPKRGWDGTLNGKPQDGQAFIWTAQYKFEGNNEKTETVKGSLMLVR